MRKNIIVVHIKIAKVANSEIDRHWVSAQTRSCLITGLHYALLQLISSCHMSSSQLDAWIIEGSCLITGLDYRLDC